MLNNSTPIQVKNARYVIANSPLIIATILVTSVVSSLFMGLFSYHYLSLRGFGINTDTSASSRLSSEIYNIFRLRGIRFL